MIRRLPALIGLLLALAACDAPAAPRSGPSTSPTGRYADTLHRVPVSEEDGRKRAIVMRVCHPPGQAGPAPLVVLNHGSPGTAEARRRMQPYMCESGAVQWFLARGYVAAIPLRRGYGADNGAWSETYGRCETPDFVAAGRETARDIAAALAYARGLPEVDAGIGALVVGQSAGGWGTIALSANPPPGVAGLVNFAGGRAGRIGGLPNYNCRPDQLVASAARFGGAARSGTPMLWLYAQNDSFFAPAQAARLHDAYVQAGGRADLHALGAFAQDGHTLFAGRGGAAVWGPIVEAYIRERGLPLPR